MSSYDRCRVNASFASSWVLKITAVRLYRENVGIAVRLCITPSIYNSIWTPPETQGTIDLRTQMNQHVVSAQINSFSTSAILLLLLLITILSGVMYLTIWQPQQQSIAGSIDLQQPGGLNLFQSRLNYSSHFRLGVSQTHSGIQDVWWLLYIIMHLLYNIIQFVISNFLKWKLSCINI